MDEKTLIAAIKQSGGSNTTATEAPELLARLNLLESTERYQVLLRQIAKANDKSNFLALILEANFAYQFESRKLELAYEVKQVANQTSSIDFLRIAPTGHRVYLELRLLQEAQQNSDAVKAQLEKGPLYRMTMDADGERDEIARIQSTILSKVEEKNGKPIKFFSTAKDVLNVVVVDTTAGILGAIDCGDCMLALYGDPSVDELMRRQMFGLFQLAKPEYPGEILKRAAKYENVRRKLHGVLFLFKKKSGGVLVYDLESYLFWNSALMSREKMTEGEAGTIQADIEQAVPRRREQE